MQWNFGTVTSTRLAMWSLPLTFLLFWYCFFLVFEICIEEGGCQFRCFWWCEKKLIFLLLDKIAITLQLE